MYISTILLTTHEQSLRLSVSVKEDVIKFLKSDVILRVSIIGAIVILLPLISVEIRPLDRLQYYSMIIYFSVHEGNVYTVHFMKRNWTVQSDTVDYTFII